jgi:molybdopterin molybdotransferase
VSALPTIDEALEIVLGQVAFLGAEDVPVPGAAGRVLHGPASSVVDLPPFASSAMDGYAVRAADTPGPLAVVDESAAGSPAGRALGPREAIGISTGAVVPEGADAVVPVEETRREGDEVTVVAVGSSDNVRDRGSDVRAGEVVVDGGTLLGAAQLGALAAVGLASVSCARRPRVAVLATGSELRRPGDALGPGEIYESNTTLLSAQLRSAGAEPVVLAPAADDEAATRAALEKGLRHDVLVSSGGVSMGEHDLVRGALAALGSRELFWRVAVKPGKPVSFGVAGSTLVFGLPGNPVSSLVGFELFVRPALRALQGHRAPGPRYLPGVLGAAVRRDEGRDQLLRARSRVDGAALVLDPLTGQESHMIGRAASADALVLVRRGAGELPAGTAVQYLPI